MTLLPISVAGDPGRDHRIYIPIRASPGPFSSLSGECQQQDKLGTWALPTLPCAMLRRQGTRDWTIWGPQVTISPGGFRHSRWPGQVKGAVN